MKAMQVKHFGDPPALVDIPKPKPGPGQVLIKIFWSENFNFNFFSNAVGLIFIK